jgi:hypothetical protein
MAPPFDGGQCAAPPPPMRDLENAIETFLRRLVATVPHPEVQQQLLRRFNLAEDDAEPDFDFELDDVVSVEQVEAHCRHNNLNFMTYTRELGERLYYNRNYNNEDVVVPEWVEMSRYEAADPARELHMVVFADRDQQTRVDWTFTLGNLKRLAHDMVYTERMMHGCLLRLVNRFCGELADMLRSMTANEVARYLLNMDSRLNRRIYRDPVV